MTAHRHRWRAGLAPRWRVVAALFVVTSCLATSISAFGVFLPVLAETFGWRRGAISVGLSINLLLGGLVAFGIAHAADRRGPRAVLLATVLVGAAGFALSATISALWQFYLTYGVLVGIGMSSIYVLTTATVSRWFVEQRGLALALVLSGFNLGWLLGGPLVALVIGVWGWRGAYVALGLLVACVAGPTTLAVRYPDGGASTPAAGGAGPWRAARRMAGDPRLWLLGTTWFALGLVFMMVNAHSVPFGRDLGLSLDRASLVLTAYGIGAAVGRLASGLATDRFGTHVTMQVCLAAQALALVVLVAGPPAWAVAVAVVAFGVGAAGADNAFVRIVPEVFGLAALATVTSVLGLGWRTGAAVGPAAAGFLHDATGSYVLPFAGAVGVLALGSALFALGARREAALAERA